MNKLDPSLVRKHFPAFDGGETTEWAFFENAGGTFPVRHVVERLERFYRHTKVQPYGHSPFQKEAGEEMDAGRKAIADLFGLPSESISLGPSTTQNFNTLAAGFNQLLNKGDEIIVCEQDHEANIGAWVRLAELTGAIVRFWAPEPERGQLSLDVLQTLFTDRTRLVAVTHSSNIVGSINPIKEISALAHKAGAWAVADGVSYAPHGLPDIAKLGVDAYCFSTYKTFGTHMGVMYVGDELASQLTPQCHYFNKGKGHARFDAAGPDHASIAALKGIADYFEQLHADHSGDTSLQLHEKVQECSKAIKHHESALVKPVFDILKNKSVRIYGTDSADDQREANIAITCPDISSSELNLKLAEHKIACGNGDFYAPRILKAMGIDDLTDGVLRLSFAHYNTSAEVDQLINALDSILPNGS